MAKKLEVKNLKKSFGPEVAVDDMSFSIEDGMLKSLLGPSGCGKTTTLRCIAGLEDPDAGEIYIDGELVAAPEQDLLIPSEKRGIGMVFQNYAIWPHMTVAENVMFPLKHLGVGSSKQERQDRVDEILETVDLSDHADDLAPNLSGGQQQRVALARALVAEPELLLLDEPLSNLDAKLRKEMRHELLRICDELGVTMLYVTHSQDEALFLSDEVAIMNDGHLMEEGPPDVIHSDPKSFFGMSFLGQCNIFPGEVTSGDRDSELHVETHIGEITSTNVMDDVTTGDKVNVCFRPKVCDIAPIDGDVSSLGEANRFQGTAGRCVTTTDYFEYYVEVNGQTVLVRKPEKANVSEGDNVEIAIDQGSVKVFSQDREVSGETVDPVQGSISRAAP